VRELKVLKTGFKISMYVTNTASVREGCNRTVVILVEKEIGGIW